ncbi:MAG: HD domain-containing protein [Solirubrobacteraceae bacterium]|nr:HD domain-containing protein [Solirubrobacteraceae bacterium]
MSIALSCTLIVVACALVPPSSIDEALDPLTVLLVALGTVAHVLDSRWEHRVTISGCFAILMLTAAVLGPAGVFIVAAGSELGAWVIQRFKVGALLSNIAGATLPGVLAGLAFQEMLPASNDLVFALEVALVATGANALNYLINAPLAALFWGTSVRDSFRLPVALIPAILLTIGFTVVIVAAAESTSLIAPAAGLLLVIAFAYGAHLVVSARERTREYASLSWGVLSGLVRTLDQRDPHAARHSAAVAAFSRDIAKQVGMSERDQELAHTAGLLHDIGRFAFGDRILKPGHELTQDDWRSVRRHPEIGADLLPDLQVYGPVAEIVRAHHERVDGRGYPDGLKGEDIPAIARIVAVAEAYDTLTAEDTYRKQMTSFEALTELRRVVGTQLDGTYVEALAALLAGRGVDYRHADTADFDHELAIQRRIADAVG